MITLERMNQLVPSTNHDILVCCAPRFEELRVRYGVITPMQVAHLMAQLAHESGGFRKLTENLDYSAKRIGEVWSRLAPRALELEHNPVRLGNAAYALKNGNGIESTGDGYRFRGRGFIQLTGRANYTKYGAMIGVDLINRPERAAWPELASELALAYWKDSGCNGFASNDDVPGVTKAINGGLMGLDERKKLTERAKEIFV